MSYNYNPMHALSEYKSIQLLLFNFYKFLYKNRLYPPFLIFPFSLPPSVPGLLGNLTTNGPNFMQSLSTQGMHPGDEFTGKSPPNQHHLAELINKNSMEIKVPTSSSSSSAMNKLDSCEDKQQSVVQNTLFTNGGPPGGVVGMPPNFMMLSRMMMDPALMQMQAAAQYPIFGQIPPQLTAPPQSPQHQQQQQQQLQSPINPSLSNGVGGGGDLNMKELISTPSCTLFPPNPTVPPPTTRERPPGCRTVFVGGLPENITEDMIREVFDRCGEITTLRLSKKNFCHIRYAFEASVDSAIYLSGYRMRITAGGTGIPNNSSGSSANSAESLSSCGRLHVDYAQARDDQYEYECKQRQLQREARHRERMEKDRLRPLSPPLIVHYTDHEASSVSEKLKQEESFAKAVQTLITWLERGDCSKKNSNTFYSMIQSSNSHVRRLSHEKQTCEEELRKAKDLCKTHMQSIVVQCK